MNKNEKKKVTVSGLIIVATFLLYAFTDFFCGGNCYPFVHGHFSPVYKGILGLSPSLILLVFFSRNIYISWIKHIAWWFAIVTAYAVANTSQGGFLPFYSRDDVVLFWMAILFIITFIYALIMNKRLKEKMTP